MLVSAVAHILLIIIIYLTLRRISKLLAITVSFLVAFSPSFTRLVLSWGMTEPLYVLFLWLAIYFGWQTIISSRKIYCVLAGIFFGLSYFIRTDAMYTLCAFFLFSFLYLSFKERKKIKQNYLSLVKNFVFKMGLIFICFLLINLPYITVISMQLGKPTISGKYAYIGSSHPFTPEKDRLTTWAQDIWSIDFPNYRSPYYDSTRVLPILWKNQEIYIEAFLKIAKTNLGFYVSDILSKSEIIIIFLGFLSVLLQKRFRVFALYLLIIWLVNFILITYFMETTVRYLAFSLPLIYIYYGFSVFTIGQIFSKANKILLPLTVAIFSIFYLNNNFNLTSFQFPVRVGLYSDQKEIGDWLKSQKIDLFMGRTEGIGFYANAKMVYMPAANPETIIKFAKAWGVEYLVARPDEASWDYMRIIVSPSFTHPDLELKHKFDDRTLIWKVKLTEKEKLHNFRTTEDVNKKFKDININSQIKI